MSKNLLKYDIRDNRIFLNAVTDKNVKETFDFDLLPRIIYLRVKLKRGDYSYAIGIGWGFWGLYLGYYKI